MEDSDSRFRQLADAITDYVFTVYIAKDGAIRTHHSANCVAITGYTPADFATDPMLWIRMVLPDDRGLVNRQAAQILSGQDAPSIEHRIRRKDNVVRWVLNTPIPTYDERGRLTSYDGVVRDITERRQMEEQRSTASGNRNANAESGRHDFSFSKSSRAPLSESDRQHITALLQEDLQQLLVAARYQVDRLTSQTVHDPTFNRSLDGVNDLLGRCAKKAREISRKLMDESQLNFELKGNGK